MVRLIQIAFGLGLCFAQPAPLEAQITPVAVEAPAGTYLLDKAHAKVIFSIDHLGFSRYMATFPGLDGTLEFDPLTPEAMRLTAVCFQSESD